MHVMLSSLIFIYILYSAYVCTSYAGINNRGKDNISAEEVVLGP